MLIGLFQPTPMGSGDRRSCTLQLLWPKATKGLAFRDLLGLGSGRTPTSNGQMTGTKEIFNADSARITTTTFSVMLKQPDKHELS